MEKQNIVYSNQIFVKRKPKSNMSKINEALKELELSIPLYNSCYYGLKETIKEGRKVDDSALIAYSLLRARIRHLTKQIRMPFDDSADCCEFFFLCTLRKPCEATLYNKDEQFVLISTKGNKSASFSSIDELLDDYIPLDTILAEGEFIGRRMKEIIPLPVPIYVMYKYKDNMIVCNVTESGKVYISPAGLTAIEGKRIKTDDIVFGPVNKSLEGTEKLKKKIYKMKTDYERQID